MATGFPLDVDKNVPAVWSQLLIGCEANTEYNILVENIEYYDELNLRVSWPLYVGGLLQLFITL